MDIYTEALANISQGYEVKKGINKTCSVIEGGYYWWDNKDDFDPLIRLSSLIRRKGYNKKEAEEIANVIRLHFKNGRTSERARQLVNSNGKLRPSDLPK